MNRTLKMVAGIVLVALYVVGLVLMLTGQFSSGLTLWVISTLGGVGFLYYNRQCEERAKAEKENQEPEARK